MATAREQMNTIKSELERVRRDIDNLKIEEGILEKLLLKMTGEPVPVPVKRKRSPNVTPLVIDIMRNAAEKGATSAEVDALVRLQIPGVANASVASILSRLKSEGALIYVGERYYEKRFAPPPTTSPFDLPLRAVI